MIDFSRFELENGLRFIVNEDTSTPLVAMNILYDVGARDEDPDATGLAHLFEHLMFGGSLNIPDYDTSLQMAGGENNAFTNNDITNYYLTVPSENIETAFWLESDRMLALDFSQKNLDTQKNVVIEEFRQRYLNQPYGDVILKLRPLAYNVHPYRWSAIGMEIAHIENAYLEQIKEFYFSHYAPNNAVISLSGNVRHDLAYKLAQKWFGPIGKRKIRERKLPQEPVQTESKSLYVEKDVPSDALYMVWHVGPRNCPDFYSLDLVTDLLAGGESGRLYTKLVREEKLFSEINAYLTSEIDPGLLFINGKLMKDIEFQHAEESIKEVLAGLLLNSDTTDEMEKVKNRFESSTVFSNTSILNRAISLCYFELLGDADMINHDTDKYRIVTHEMVVETTRRYLIPSNCSTLYYKSSGKEQHE